MKYAINISTNPQNGSFFYHSWMRLSPPSPMVAPLCKGIVGDFVLASHS